jgi:hypothetical protein
MLQAGLENLGHRSGSTRPAQISCVLVEKAMRNKHDTPAAAVGESIQPDTLKVHGPAISDATVVP